MKTEWTVPGEGATVATLLRHLIEETPLGSRSTNLSVWASTDEPEDRDLARILVAIFEYAPGPLHEQAQRLIEEIKAGRK